MDVLTLILLSLSGVYSDSHSLRYYTTGVSAPGFGLPEFSIVGYVDDQEIEFYNSDTRRRVPVAQWMKVKERPEYWEVMAQFNEGQEALFKHEVKTGMKRFNHTEGFHFVQVMTCCELRDDGSTVGYQQYRYDGEEYMYYDIQTETFIPTMSEAQITTQKWNSLETGMNEIKKNYLETECFERLKRFLEYGREDLERRVLPHVKVTSRESGGITKLHCMVYGFHPRAVDVKWMKNEIDDVPSYETTNVLPNPDGTYQIRVSVEVIPKEGESYSCYVDHSSLEKQLLVKWDLKQNSPLTVIISAVVIILLLLTLVTAGVVIYKNTRE